MNLQAQPSLGRRRFLAVVASGAASLPGWNYGWAEQSGSPAAPPGSGLRNVLLSSTGGDRATGYVMSNKVVRRPGQLIATWLDSRRQNRWAAVDLTTLELVRSGPVGPPGVDNHCGSAMTSGPDGALHLLVGAHHGPFSHYCMPPGGNDWQRVEGSQEAAWSGTYPSVVCDGNGTLHLTYRHEPGGHDAQLHYCRRPPNGRWSPPRSLMRSAVSEHSWLTNAIEVGPDGRLHVVVSNTLPAPQAGNAARYYGASHLYSDDFGDTWRQFGSPQALALPVPGAELRRIEGDAMPPERTQREYGGPRGPEHSYYNKILLSNPITDDRGRPWLILHNVLAGDAELYRHEEGRGWTPTPLLNAVRSVLPGFDIRHCGQLSRHRDGTIEGVLMVAPPDQRGWGPPGTELVRFLASHQGDLLQTTRVRPPDPDTPHWLPSIERWCWHSHFDRPALLFTRGQNAGGYDHNRNDVNTEVWLQIG